MIFCKEKAVCLRKTPHGVDYPTIADVPNGELQYLFAIDDRAFYLWCDPLPTLDGWEWASVETFRFLSPQWMGFAGITAYRLWLWYRQNRFCGCCGHPLQKHRKERAMVCPACGNLIFPTIAPSVIVAVVHDDRLLLTRYAASHSSYKHYALVAGYTEIGESLEHTVHREVWEETGLRVKHLRFYKSQPWPFSGAILSGFFCTLDGSDVITLEQEELSEAVWLTREEISAREDRSSLTNEMIEVFRSGDSRWWK